MTPTEHANMKPRLGIIQVSDRFDSNLFISTKVKKCEFLGFGHTKVALSENTSKSEVNRSVVGGN